MLTKCTVFLGVGLLAAALAVALLLPSRSGGLNDATPGSDLQTSRPEDREPVSICPDARRADEHAYGRLRLVVDRDEHGGCHVALRSDEGTPLAATDDSGDATVVYVQYFNLDADAVPELIVVADTGGTSGYAQSFVLTERPAPALVGTWRGCGFVVTNAPGSGRALRSCDLSYAMAENLCNACSPRPSVYFTIENGRLVLRNDIFGAAYDQHVKELEASLENADIPSFLAAASPEDAAYRDFDGRGPILAIALDYVYSNRPALAREVIETLWPAWDRARVLADLKPPARNAGSPTALDAAPAAALPYGQSATSIDGILALAPVPNTPEGSATYPVLLLLEPVRVGDGLQTQEDVFAIQLVSNKASVRGELIHLAGQSVTVVGSLERASGPEQHTSVVLSARSIDVR